MRRLKNIIIGLKDAGDAWKTKDEDFASVVTQHFGDLITTSYPIGMDEVLACIQPKSPLRLMLCFTSFTPMRKLIVP